METNLSAKSFYNTWGKVVENRKEEMLNIWRNKKEFTWLIKGSQNSVLAIIAKELDLLSYEADYYLLDAILYKKEDLVPDLPINKYWFRDIKVAFEHENDFKSGLYQEVSHLLITNCDLKVLVSYPEYPEEELKKLHRIIRETKHSKTIHKQESFLIILGYENNFEWEGYIYKEDDWMKI